MGPVTRAMRLPQLLTTLALVSLTAAGCAKGAQLASSPAAVQAGAQAPVLDRSVFARDPNGQLSENAIQAILGSQLEIELPARVGILPVMPAADFRGPGPSYERAPRAVAEIARHIRSPELFTLVTEMIPIPSGALGMEALREIAARYKLRYVLLYREDTRHRERLNAWAIGYATVIGTLFLPGEDLKIDGYVEASLFDVKTGLLLFTKRRRVAASRRSNVWYQGDKLDDLQARLAIKVGEDLANDVRRGVIQYAAAVRVENERIAERNQGAPEPAAGPVTATPDGASVAVD